MTAGNINRRALLAGVSAVAGATALPAFAQGAGSIKIGTWGGSWRDSLDKLVGERVRAAGGAVDYVIDTPQGNLAKLIAARGQAAPFDNMESGLELVQLMAADRFVLDLDFDKIPNAKALPDYARAKSYVMSVATQDGILYNHDKFKELGVAPPERYGDLDNQKLQGRVAFPDINHTQHWNAVAGLAYEAGASEADLFKSIPLINKIKPAYFFSASTDIATKLASGEIWAAPLHAGFAVRLRRNSVPLSVTYPRFGEKRGSLWPVLHHIVRGTQNEALAARFLDAYLDPEVQFAHAKATGVLPINRAALKRLGEDPENKSVLMFKNEELDNLFVIDFSKVKLADWRSAWNRDVKRG